MCVRAQAHPNRAAHLMLRCAAAGKHVPEGVSDNQAQQQCVGVEAWQLLVRWAAQSNACCHAVCLVLTNLLTNSCPPPPQETPLSPTDITIDSDFMPILKEVSGQPCVGGGSSGR